MRLRNTNPISESEISEITSSRERVSDFTAPGHGKYHIWTIGCQMNVADSNHVAAELEKIGYDPTDDVDAADVVVLNTCVVRQSAEDKGAGKASSLKPWKQQRPNRTLALMGCMVGVKPSPQLRAAFPHVDVFMPPSEASPLIGYLREEELAAEASHIEQEQLARRYRMQDDVQPVGVASGAGYAVGGGRWTISQLAFAA